MISGRRRDQRHVHVGERNAGSRKAALRMGSGIVPDLPGHFVAIGGKPPQQGSAVGDGVDRRRGGDLRLHALGVDRKRTRSIALLKRNQRLMPGDMAMQQPGANIACASA